MNSGTTKARPPLPAGPYLVVGLARSGQAVGRLLAGRGERVLGADSGHPEGAAGLADAGVEVSLDVDGTGLLDGIRTLVKSPGVPQEAAVVERARKRGIEVTGELEVAWRLLPNRFVGVTGTNGKTTTTELIGHLYRTAGEPVAVAGNVGTPLASLVGELDPEVTIACECSSFQLEDAEAFAPECAVLLNVAPDHLDRHGSLDEYTEAKLRIFAWQANEDVAVYNADQPEIARRDLGGCGRRLAFCPESAGPDCELSLRGEVIFYGDGALVETSQLRLIGRHNVANAMAAAAAALSMGIDSEAVRDGLRGFEGVAHRLERVAEIGRVTYVNDSKATNVASALAGIAAFDGGLHLILGGSLKGESFEPLAQPVAERCSACYLIGEAAERLEAVLAPAAERGVELRRCPDLGEALREASAAAEPGEVVLLSPACASFDAYADFEARGEDFRRLVEGLA